MNFIQNASTSGWYTCEVAQALTWSLWNSATTCSATTNVIIYDTSALSVAATTIQNLVWGQWHESDEQYRARKRAQKTDEERQRAAWAERQCEEQIAKGKAKALLIEHLSRAQRATYEEKGYFDVEVAGKTYRIHQGTHGNVRRLDGGREAVRYCAQPDGVPAEDAMLAQKLMLETDEAAFLKVANASPLIIPAHR